jgi:anti-anti-sigma factor
MAFLNTENRGRIKVVSINARGINALNADELKDHLGSLFSKHNSTVILDLKGVENIDSSGFGCFLISAKTAKNNYGIFKLANAGPSVMKIFKTLHLESILDICPDIESCIRSLKQ